MIFEISKKDIKNLLNLQLTSFFGKLNAIEVQMIDDVFSKVFADIEYNFSKNKNKYYHCQTKNGDETYFNPFHAGQWTIFLYYMSYSIAHNKDGGHICSILADKIYYLNKALNSCDLFHQVKLPQYFSLDHPVGSVIGRAQYGEGFSFGQYCTVGNNHDIYPIIGKNCRMCMNSAILGNSHIGNNVIIGAGAIVKDQNVPDNSIIFGESPNLIIIHKK